MLIKNKRNWLAVVFMIGLVLASCSRTDGGAGTRATDSPNAFDTVVWRTQVKVDSLSFIVFKMNGKAAYVTMADSVMPEERDSAVALCVEGAFTGNLLKEFKTTNIAGDYVIDGVFHRGYKCRANTGFLYADRETVVISSSENVPQWIDRAKKTGGTLFQQMLIVSNGRDVYRGKPIKPTSTNIYRSACIMQDGSFAVIQSVGKLPLGTYINSLIKLGVKNALYLDMGPGWNYGWYRETPASPAVKLFKYRTPYQTNWLLIKVKPRNW